MLLVVIGAGASYDSSPDLQPDTDSLDRPRPPLADDLFLSVGIRRSVRQEFSQLEPLIPLLLRRKGRSLEQSLQQLQEECPTNPDRLQQLTAVRYYLQMLFRKLNPAWLGATDHATNYAALFDQIANLVHELVFVATFNYDTLIESALTRRFGLSFSVMADYVTSSQFKLFKLHGSENWAREMASVPPGMPSRSTEPEKFRRETIRRIAEIALSDTYTIDNPRDSFLFPAIAIPILTKDTFECPADHVGTLVGGIPSITKVLTIGWRGMEEHFLNLLAQHLPRSARVRLLTVAGNLEEAQETANRISARIQTIPYDYFMGFSACVAERKFDEFLILRDPT